MSILVIFTLIDLPQLLAQESDPEWTTFTIRRVNLREAPGGMVLRTLDEGAQVTVFGEISEWLHVYSADGDSGWISNTSYFVVPKAALDSLPEIKNALLQLQSKPEISTQDITEDTIPEFAAGLSEPLDIMPPGENEQGSFFKDIFFLIPFALLLISLIVNFILRQRIRSLSVAGAGLSDSNKLLKDFQLLKRECEDLKSQLRFAEEKYAKHETTSRKREKELQMQNDLHRNENTELQSKFNKLKDIHSQASQTIKLKSEQIDKLGQDNKNLHKELENIHKKLNESTDNLQQQAVKRTLAEQRHKDEILLKETEFQRRQKEIDETRKAQLHSEKDALEKTSQLKKENDSLVAKLSELERVIAMKDQSINDHIARAKKEFEVSSASREAALENLQKEYKELLSVYEKSQQELKNARISLRAGGEPLPKTIHSLDKKMVERTPFPEAEGGRRIYASTKESRLEYLKTDQYDEYLKNFFKKISRLK